MRNKVIASGRQNYGGKWFNRGEEIETNTEQDAEDLVALNFASYPTISEQNGKEYKKYRRKDLKAEP